MSDEAKKVNSETLTVLKGLQGKWDDLTKKYGEVYFNYLLVKEQFDSAKEQLDSAGQALFAVEKLRRETVLKLQEEFGSSGVVNLETGEFTPEKK